MAASTMVALVLIYTIFLSDAKLSPRKPTTKAVYLVAVLLFGISVNQAPNLASHVKVNFCYPLGMFFGISEHNKHMVLVWSPKNWSSLFVL